MKLYGETIKAVKYPKQAIPAHLQSQGIKTCLNPGWQGEAKIILTTYENASRPGVFSGTPAVVHYGVRRGTKIKTQLR